MITVQEAADISRVIIAKEVSLQSKMWGDANDRADASSGQMLHAAQAQLELVHSKVYERMDQQSALALAKSRHYPKDWSGFRDYGSNIANLAVAAAYLQNEIKRLVMNGEDSFRAPRPASDPYNPETGLPNANAIG
jgi:hypothetical protein